MEQDGEQSDWQKEQQIDPLGGQLLHPSIHPQIKQEDSAPSHSQGPQQAAGKRDQGDGEPAHGEKNRRKAEYSTKIPNSLWSQTAFTRGSSQPPTAAPANPKGR